jgi:hypothetical protein
MKLYILLLLIFAISLTNSQGTYFGVKIYENSTNEAVSGVFELVGKSKSFSLRTFINIFTKTQITNLTLVGENKNHTIQIP